MNKETGIDVDINLDDEIRVVDDEIDDEKSVDKIETRKRDTITLDERDLIEQFIMKNGVKKCPTVYANGALKNSLDN